MKKNNIKLGSDGFSLAVFETLVSDSNKFRQGIAMVELIFSIVIIGIALLSAPMLIHQSIQSSNVALQQEAIAAVATHTGIVLSKHWDEADANSTLAPILAIVGNSGDFNISSFGTDPINQNIRAGMQNTIGRASASDIGELVFASSGAFGTPSSDNDISPNTFDDVDDYHNSEIKLTALASSPTGDYIDNNFTIKTTITYARDTTTGSFDDTPVVNNIFNNTGGTQSHIKFVSVRLTTNSLDPELEKNISMSAFSCNIGTYIPDGVYR